MTVLVTLRLNQGYQQTQVSEHACFGRSSQVVVMVVVDIAIFAVEAVFEHVFLFHSAMNSLVRRRQQQQQGTERRAMKGWLVVIVESSHCMFPPDEIVKDQLEPAFA